MIAKSPEIDQKGIFSFASVHLEVGETLVSPHKKACVGANAMLHLEHPIANCGEGLLVQPVIIVISVDMPVVYPVL